MGKKTVRLIGLLLTVVMLSGLKPSVTFAEAEKGTYEWFNQYGISFRYDKSKWHFSKSQDEYGHDYINAEHVTGIADVSIVVLEHDFIDVELYFSIIQELGGFSDEINIISKSHDKIEEIEIDTLVFSYGSEADAFKDMARVYHLPNAKSILVNAVYLEDDSKNDLNLLTNTLRASDQDLENIVLPSGDKTLSVFGLDYFVKEVYKAKQTSLLDPNYYHVDGYEFLKAIEILGVSYQPYKTVLPESENKPDTSYYFNNHGIAILARYTDKYNDSLAEHLSQISSVRRTLMERNSRVEILKFQEHSIMLGEQSAYQMIEQEYAYDNVPSAPYFEINYYKILNDKELLYLTITLYPDQFDDTTITLLQELSREYKIPLTEMARTIS